MLIFILLLIHLEHKLGLQGPGLNNCVRITYQGKYCGEVSILWHISRPGPRLLLPRCSRLRIKDGRLSPAVSCQLGGGSRVLIGAIDHRPSTEQSGAVHRYQTSLNTG